MRVRPSLSLPQGHIARPLPEVKPVNPIDEEKIYMIYQKPQGGKLYLSNLKSALSGGLLARHQISTVPGRSE